MSGSAAPFTVPPSIDQGDPPGLLAVLRHELAPTPGRLGNTLRLVVLVLTTVAISETFRIPETALSCFIVLLVSRDQRSSTIQTALISAVAAVAALLMTIMVFMASLAEPALRLPLIAIMTCAAMFLARASPLGPILFVAGFIMAYGLTLGDEVLGLSLQPGIVGNTTDFAIPQLAYLPPEEALVHFLLWIALAVALPAALVILANLLTGCDPALMLRAALAERLAAAGRFCAGEPGAQRTLTALAREGSAELLKLYGMSRPPRRRETDGVLIDQVGRLCLVLLAAARLPLSAWPGGPAAGAAEACHEAERAVQHGTTLPDKPAPEPAVAVNPIARPLVAELTRTLRAIRVALATPPGAAPATGRGVAPAKPNSAHRLLAPDAFSNPAHIRFALKVTLAVMLCYAIEDLTDWPGIHTCIITCFFVSLGTVGETVHKATLRITGCLIGGVLSIGTILLLMPVMTDLGDLLMVLAAVTFLAGWVGSGSERIAYAGWQIGLAFYLAILQGNGPTLDMETARDRIIGIIVGNIAVSIIFTTIWPVGVDAVVRPALVKALEQLAALLTLQARPDKEAAAAEPELRQTFGGAIAQARGVLVNDAYEAPFLSGRHVIDTSVLLQVQALMVPVSVILDLRTDPAWVAVPQPARDAIVAHHQSMANWLHRCAAWVRSGVGAVDVAATLPAPPDLGHWIADGPAADHLAARATWYALLHQDIRAILGRVVPVVPSAQRIALAPA